MFQNQTYVSLSMTARVALGKCPHKAVLHLKIRAHFWRQTGA